MQFKISQPSDVWRRVDQRGPDECWEWTGSRFTDGYGQVGYQHKHWRAHRLIYTFVYGDIPEGLFVCHTCDHPLCCNPSHLWLGTPLDNHNDMKAKGRAPTGDLSGSRKHPESRARGERNWMHRHSGRLQDINFGRGDHHWTHRCPEKVARGERVHGAKLTAEDVENIRTRHAEGMTHVAVARLFGVTPTAIGLIIRGKNWRSTLPSDE